MNMSRYDFNIPKHTKEKIFFSIREKKDVISLLIETIKFIKASSHISENTDAKIIIISKSKMSRIFYILNNKYFSIIFPFRIEVNEEEYRFFLKDGTELTYEFLSKITELIKNEVFFKTFEDFVNEIFDKNNTFLNEEKIWDFMKEICFLEYGYLRYDYDLEHENGNFHPLNHLDINYSNRTTFKLGLSKEITTQEFVDMLDNTLERKFIKL